MLTVENWTIEEQTGYKPITTFYTDFSIADKFGINAIQDTYNRTFKSWKSNINYITELVMVLNWKCWRWYEVNNEYSRLYIARWDHEMLDRIMYEMKTASDYVHEHGQYPSGWNSIMETYRLLRQQEEQQKQQSAPKPTPPQNDIPDKSAFKPKSRSI